MSADLALLFIRAVTQQVDAEGGPASFDTSALRGLRELQAAPGRFSCILPVTPPVQNRYGTLHGGCIATLVDTVGSAALITLSPRGGVSLNINVNYLSKAPAGSRVRVEAQVVKVGKTIATIEVQLKDEASGELIAQGTHIKFLAVGEPAMDFILAQQAQQGQQAQGQRAPPLRARL